MIIKPLKTYAGSQATFNAQHTGLALALTHMSLGDSAGEPDRAQVVLRNERVRVPLFGSPVAVDCIQLDAVFNDPTAFWVQEIGIWAGTTLVYVWSSPNQVLGHKAANTDWLLSCPLKLDEVEQSVIQVTAPPPNLMLTQVPFMATVLKATCDTNRLLLTHLMTTKP